MSEIPYLLKRHEHLIRTGMFCTINKRNTITIPTYIREKLCISKREEVIISINKHLNGILIYKYTFNTFENVMVINENGSIRIPQELRKLYSLKTGDAFDIYLCNNNSFMILRKVDQ